MKTVSLLVAMASALVSGPALAATVVENKCVSVADPAGCLFRGNINGNTDPLNVNSFLNAQNAYNALRDPDLSLSFITKSDDADFGMFGSMTGAGTANGTWSLPGYSVTHLAVKASNRFVLYRTSGSQGAWSTQDIPFERNPHDISHLAFFGTPTPAGAVPEPTTWALMILGFAAVGAGLRRQRGNPALRAA